MDGGFKACVGTCLYWKEVIMLSITTWQLGRFLVLQFQLQAASLLPSATRRNCNVKPVTLGLGRGCGGAALVSRSWAGRDCLTLNFEREEKRREEKRREEKRREEKRKGSTKLTISY